MKASAAEVWEQSEEPAECLDRWSFRRLAEPRQLVREHWAIQALGAAFPQKQRSQPVARWTMPEPCASRRESFSPGDSSFVIWRTVWSALPYVALAQMVRIEAAARAQQQRQTRSRPRAYCGGSTLHRNRPLRCSSGDIRRRKPRESRPSLVWRDSERDFSVQTVVQRRASETPKCPRRPERSAIGKVEQG